MRVFIRTLIRANVQICYSEGFNPHPKITLPLPRSVGTESVCDRICILVQRDAIGNQDEVKAILETELPADIDIVSLRIEDGVVKYAPRWVEYLFPLDASKVDRIETRVSELDVRLGEGDPITAQRINNKKRISKTILLNDYILELVLEPLSGIRVKCMLSPNGTVRIDELLAMLELEIETLSGPVTRLAIDWASK